MKISQDIDIRTIDGVKVDMLAGETVEVVMGGFSLLDLSLRSANYTTSFELPRTPANESIFEFASETTRYNRPNIPIFARLFQFLMVQLKDAKAANVSIEDTYFNSLWFN